MKDNIKKFLKKRGIRPNEYVETIYDHNVFLVDILEEFAKQQGFKFSNPIEGVNPYDTRSIKKARKERGFDF